MKGPHCLLSAHCLHTLSTRCLVEASRLHVGVEASRLGVEVSRILYVNHGWSHRGKRRGCVEVSRLRRGHASILHRACIEPNVEDVEARAQRAPLLRKALLGKGDESTQRHSGWFRRVPSVAFVRSSKVPVRYRRSDSYDSYDSYDSPTVRQSDRVYTSSQPSKHRQLRQHSDSTPTHCHTVLPTATPTALRQHSDSVRQLRQLRQPGLKSQSNLQ